MYPWHSMAIFLRLNVILNSGLSWGAPKSCPSLAPAVDIPAKVHGFFGIFHCRVFVLAAHGGSDFRQAPLYCLCGSGWSIFSFIPEICTRICDYHKQTHKHTQKKNLRLWGQAQAINSFVFSFIQPQVEDALTAQGTEIIKHNWESGECLLNVFRANMEEFIEHILPW